MKRWIKCLGEYQRDALLSPLFVAIEVVMDVGIPVALAEMIDKGMAAGNMNEVLKMGIIMMLMCTVSLISGFVGGRFSARAAAGFAKNLRKGMYYKIQDFSFSNIDKFSTNSLVTRLTTDVTNLQNSAQMILRLCARAPLMIIFAVIMAFRVSTELAWIFLAVIPFLAIGFVLITLNAHPIFIKVFRLYDRLNGVVQENVRGVRVVKNYVREAHEVGKFEDSSEEIFQKFVKAEKILAFNSPMMQFSMYVCFLVISWLGAKMIISDGFTTGQLTSLITYAIQVLINLMLLSVIFVMLVISKASAGRIAEVMDETSDMQNKENPVMAVPDGSIKFNNMSFSYRGVGGKLCLQDINIHIKSGQTVGIIGGTGSGKSTLVQLIPRLYDVTEGTLDVGGVDVREYDIETLRNDVAMVLQKNVLFAGTIKENMRWGNKEATDEEILHACKLAQADEFIQGLQDKYDTWIEQGGSNVSGGQRQRLCIARALLKRPKILILDDSTSAVDTKTDALIRRAFREEIPNTTKLIIAQRISSVQNADQIIVMDNGRISAIGTHESLLGQNEIYREVYESQQKGGLGTDAAE